MAAPVPYDMRLQTILNSYVEVGRLVREVVLFLCLTSDPRVEDVVECALNATSMLVLLYVEGPKCAHVSKRENARNLTSGTQGVIDAQTLEAAGRAVEMSMLATDTTQPIGLMDGVMTSHHVVSGAYTAAHVYARVVKGRSDC